MMRITPRTPKPEGDDRFESKPGRVRFLFGILLALLAAIALASIAKFAAQ